eukprot:4762439-Pyramimonas_sp.AAC.1
MAGVKAGVTVKPVPVKPEASNVVHTPGDDIQAPGLRGFCLEETRGECGGDPRPGICLQNAGRSPEIP